MTKPHYKLSAKPLEAGCYIILTGGIFKGEMFLIEEKRGVLLRIAEIPGDWGVRWRTHIFSDGNHYPLRIQYRGLA